MVDVKVGEMYHVRIGELCKLPTGECFYVNLLDICRIMTDDDCHKNFDDSDKGDYRLEIQRGGEKATDFTSIRTITRIKTSLEAIGFKGYQVLFGVSLDRENRLEFMFLQDTD
jgi:hypothetical protein